MKKIFIIFAVLLFFFGCIIPDYDISKKYPVKDINKSIYNLSAEKTLENYFKNNTQIKIEKKILQNMAYFPHSESIPGPIQVCWGTYSISNYSLDINQNNKSFEVTVIVKCVHSNGPECKDDDLEEKYKTQKIPCSIKLNYKIPAEEREYE